MYSRRAVFQLLLLTWTISFSAAELGHVFSSSVHPCDDFHEFVCNKKANNGLSPLFKEVLDIYDDRVKEVLAKENDPIIEEFKKGSEIISEREMFLLDPYLKLLFMKFIYVNDLNPKAWKDELKPLRDEVKSEVVRMTQKSFCDSESECDSDKRIRGTEIRFGFPDESENGAMLTEIVQKIQQRFFDLKKEEVIPPGTEPDELFKAYAKLLRNAYDDVILANDTWRVRFHEKKQFDEYLEINPLATGIGFYFDENYKFIGTMMPASLYKPSTPLSIKLRKMHDTFAFAELFFHANVYFLLVEAPKNHPGRKCYYENLESESRFDGSWGPTLDAERLAADIIAKKNAPRKGRFSDLQWFFIVREATRCEETNERDQKLGTETLKHNLQFRKAFGCQPGQKMVAEKSTMCDVYQ
ncbi:hypothetical protein QR680_014542 [Steinernema hermaphroditum]|uniref:Peptidase M13 N-terminal domain-containing protein n=1 Tax=Steinernema hermaphroditum TaxID=289476 RepID=A0AA39M482_9BILA|nr:hypothetical protein QR680_014542 [Steinernema hermaphroditum]